MASISGIFFLSSPDGVLDLSSEVASSRRSFWSSWFSIIKYANVLRAIAVVNVPVMELLFFIVDHLISWLDGHTRRSLTYVLVPRVRRMIIVLNLLLKYIPYFCISLCETFVEFKAKGIVIRDSTTDILCYMMVNTSSIFLNQISRLASNDPRKHS